MLPHMINNILYMYIGILQLTIRTKCNLLHLKNDSPSRRRRVVGRRSRSLYIPACLCSSYDDKSNWFDCIYINKYCNEIAKHLPDVESSWFVFFSLSLFIAKQFQDLRENNERCTTQIEDLRLRIFLFKCLHADVVTGLYGLLYALDTTSCVRFIYKKNRFDS